MFWFYWFYLLYNLSFIIPKSELTGRAVLYRITLDKCELFVSRGISE